MSKINRVWNRTKESRMNPTQSSWGMTMIVSDLADAMDRLVDRANAVPAPRHSAKPEHVSRLGPDGRVSLSQSMRDGGGDRNPPPTSND